MNRTQACLIFNPAAGQNNPDQDLVTIRALLEPEISLDIRFTLQEVDAGTIASDAIATGASTIFASGGDAQNTQNAQPSAATTPSNIVALAASSNSFTTLSELSQ